MALWALVNTFSIPLVLFVLRNGLNYYRSAKAAYNSNKHAIRPLPDNVRPTLNLLFAFAVLALLSTFWAPENIFRKTNARLQTSTDVIFNRLAATRPLTALDEALRSKFVSRESRLLYFSLGPYVLANCPFCTSSEPNTYFIFAVPTILAPHILHAAILGLATSNFFSGSEGARWRTPATIAAFALAALELYLTTTYNVAGNTSALRMPEIDFFYWRARLLRGIIFAATDALLGWVIWLSATNRFFVRPPTLKDQLERIAQVSDLANGRLWAAGTMRNAVVRDRSLREQAGRYWEYEKDIFEDREIVNAVQGALSRVDMRQLSEMAEQRSKDVVETLQPPET